MLNVQGGYSEHEEANESTSCQQNLYTEFLWIQSTRTQKVFKNVLTCLRECCVKLHLGHKCDEKLAIPLTQPKSEQHSLTGKHGGDNIKASVTLLGDNVLQADVAIKHPKTPGGTFRAVAQPDVQWKLQQLQDLSNHILKAVHILCEIQECLANISHKTFNDKTGSLILQAAKSIVEEIAAARSAVLLPRKRSLLELCHFAPTKRFVPSLPQDQLISFYISSCRLVCASYQMVPKASSSQGLTISMAECPLYYLDDIVKLLNAALVHLEKLISDLNMTSNRM